MVITRWWTSCISWLTAPLWSTASALSAAKCKPRRRLPHSFACFANEWVMGTTVYCARLGVGRDLCLARTECLLLGERCLPTRVCVVNLVTNDLHLHWLAREVEIHYVLRYAYRNVIIS